jgi:hypothetical protein
MTSIAPLTHCGPDAVARRWFHLRTTAQPGGYLIALACPVWRDDVLACWKLGSEIWPSIVEIRGATLEEVEAHWRRLQPAQTESPDRIIHGDGRAD